MQTRYLEKIGIAVEGDDRAGGSGMAESFLLNGGEKGGADRLGKGSADSYDCALCGKSGFRCVSTLRLSLVASYILFQGWLCSTYAPRR